MLDEPERDLGSIRLPGWGRVVSTDDGLVPYLIVGPDRAVVEPVRRFLTDFVAQDNSPSSVRSYAFDLLRWWRWLRAVEVEWQRATPAEARDYVLWLRLSPKPGGQGASRPAGSINRITGKQLLDQRYRPRTVRHSNAVLRTFYAFWIERGEGPLINPIQLDRPRAAVRRPQAHHNPLEPFWPEGRIRYNPKVPKSRPRALPDERWAEVFGRLRSHRDRAILALAVSNGARANELLGMRAQDLDWGDQRIRVIRKGTRAEQWLPASPESFMWLRLYLAELVNPLAPDDVLWWTLRRRDRGAGLARQPMNYEAQRAVFRRVNRLLGTNWSMHDLRHTAALRMTRDPALTLRDVQVILGHAHLSTTADVYLIEEEAQVIQRVRQHLAERADRPVSPSRVPAAAGYDATDLAVLFGNETR